MSGFQSGPPTRTLQKTITFDGGAGSGAVGQVPVFTVTGVIRVIRILARTTASLTSGGSATVSLGHATSVAAFIAATAFGNLVNNRYWLSATPGNTLLQTPSALKDVVMFTNITMDVLVASVTGGSIAFDLQYESVNGGSVA